MLGTIGFVIGALTIGAFGVTAWQAYRVVNPGKLRLFVTAFLLFAVAMAVWGIATWWNQPDAIRPLLLTSDILLTLGTACMAFVLLGGLRIYSAVSIGLMVALLITDRASFYLPTGYVQNGLLYFNLTGGVRLAFLLAFVLVWLPAMFSIASDLARDKAFASLQHALNASFVLLVLVSASFICARRPAMIIGQFAMIAALFLAMAILNTQVMKLHAELIKGGTRHVSKRAAHKRRSK